VEDQRLVISILMDKQKVISMDFSMGETMGQLMVTIMVKIQGILMEILMEEIQEIRMVTIMAII